MAKKDKEPNFLAIGLIEHLRKGYTDQQIEKVLPGLIAEAEPNSSRAKLSIVPDPPVTIPRKP